MSTISKEQINYNFINAQNINAASDEINAQISDQAIAAMIDAMNEVLSDSDLAELAEIANGTKIDSKEAGEGQPSDEQIDSLVDSMKKIFDQADDPSYELSGKELMLQLIAALQESQSKEAEASNVVDQAHIASSLANAKQQSEDYKQDLEDMNKHHHWWNKVARVSKNWVAPALMLVVGVATENPALVMGGLMMVAMSRTPMVSAMTTGFTDLVNQIPGMPPGVANAIGAALTVAAITAITFGVGLGATAEVVADEAVEVGTELGEVASEGFATASEESSTSFEVNTQKAKSFAKLGFAMSLSEESSTFSKSLVSLVPEDDKKLRKALMVTTELIIDLIAAVSGFQGMSGMMAESEGTSAFSGLAAQLTESFGEGAGSVATQVGKMAEFVAQNSNFFMGMIMTLSGVSEVTLSANQMAVAKTTQELGRLQGDLALLTSTEALNEAGLDQEGQAIKNVVTSFLTDEKFAESMVDARNNAADLLAR